METPTDSEERIQHSSVSLETPSESATGKIDDLLAEKLEMAFHKQTSQVVLHEVAKIASEHSSIDLAYAAFRLPPGVRHVLYDNLGSIEEKIQFMINTDSGTRVAIFRNLTDQEGRALIEGMPPDEAVHVLEDISERRLRRVLELLEPEKARKIREIRQHRSNTAGRLMTNEFFSFKMEVLIGDAASTIRDHPGIDLTRRVFVVGEGGELLGYVPARNLIVNPRNLPLKQVMKPVLHKVRVEASREEVVDLVERYKVPALPVVEEDDRLVGVITYEDVVEAIEDIADETIASIAGTTEKVSEHEPLPKRFFLRAPWLIVTLCAGLVNMGVMSRFQSFEAGILTFALFFVPLITGMSGNVGIQCSTVLVRSMATGALSPGSRREAARKEVAIGLMTAVVFGVISSLAIVGLGTLGWGEMTSGSAMSLWAVGLITGTGVLGACLTGTLLGTFTPLLFMRIGVDPAVASGPIVTAINDILSMTIFFLIAIGLSAIL